MISGLPLKRQNWGSRKQVSGSSRVQGEHKDSHGWLGPSKAKQLIFTGEIIDAKTALEIGLVDKVVPHDSLMEEAKKMANMIAGKPRVALALAKYAINRGLDVDFQTALSYEIECFAQCFATQDQKEGMRAFLEKRKPNYIDK